MKTSIRITSWLLVLFSVASSAFGDDATNYDDSGYAKFVKGDLNGALADFTKAIEIPMIIMHMPYAAR
ncbi:MAG TPA: hypothetical protein VE344_07710 [Methylomirabilota bacterium]|nr:hypothetical protein [Methylomirabilota bacterium]